MPFVLFQIVKVDILEVLGRDGIGYLLVFLKR